MKRTIIAAALAALALAACAPVDEEPAPVQPADKGSAQQEAKPAKAASQPIKLQATKARFQPSALNTGGSFTSVKVTITNNTKKNLDVNPLYFAITDTGGTKHEQALGEDEKQIATITLAPGEKATGSVTGEGKFTPKTVSFSKDGFGEEARAAVA